MKILVFLHGTIIMHKDKDSVLDYANYISIGNAVEKLKGWQSQGAEILYLSSHENEKDLEKDKLVLTKYGFPEGEIYWRQNEESYANIAEKIMPDILIEDDCESIGGEKEMTYTNISPGLKTKIKQIVVKEFQGIDHLPDDLKHLKDYGKYIFDPYNPIFEELFRKELLRLKNFLDTDILIEHVGSTAVKGLGGKGIIDILIGTSKDNLKGITKKLQDAGYEFFPKASTESRLFFQMDLSDPLERVRRYHIHLTFKKSEDWINIKTFRDFLRTHPEEQINYEIVKKKAVNEARGDGLLYRKIKDSFIKNIIEKALPDKINIRPAIIEDSEALGKIHTETWQFAYRGIIADDYLDDLSIEGRIQRWKELLSKQNEDNLTLVAEVQDKTAGFCTIGKSRDEDADNKTGELLSIYMDQNYMNQGIGTALMQEGLKILREKGYEKATLWVLEENSQSRGFYESKGWKSDGKKKTVNSKGVDLHEVRYSIKL